MTQEHFIISDNDFGHPQITAEETKTIIRKNLGYHLDYLSSMRNVLVMDPIPEGVHPTYDYDYDTQDFKIFAGETDVPIEPYEHKVDVPTFDYEFKSNLPGKLNEFKAMSFYRNLEKQIIDKENGIIINLLDKAAECSEQVVISDAGNLKRMIVEAKAQVDRYDVITAKILVNKYWFSENRDSLGDGFDPAYHDHDSNKLGYIYGADIMQANIPKGVLYVMADAEFVGVMPIMKDIEVDVIDNDNVAASYNIGCAIICPQHVCKIYTRICSI